MVMMKITVSLTCNLGFDCKVTKTANTGSGAMFVYGLYDFKVKVTSHCYLIKTKC